MIEKAKAFAKKAHKNQRRKISKDLYIHHPIRVAEFLKKAKASEELICAAYLHDVIEDTPYARKHIEEKFGKRVADLVSAHTEDKSKTWKERKLQAIELLKDPNTDKEVRYLIIADRLDNLLDLEKDLKKFGDSIWEQFNAGYEKQKWYNESFVKYMYNGLEKNEIPYFFSTFAEGVTRIFHANKSGADRL